MKLSQTRIAIVLAILVATSSGCGVINRIRSKNQLNEAARAYREGKFPEAEQHSREAAATGSRQQDCSDVYRSHDPRSVSTRRANSGEYCQGPARQSRLISRSSQRTRRTTKPTRRSLISTERSKKTTS